jgi:hypothetical protein
LKYLSTFILTGAGIGKAFKVNAVPEAIPIIL